MKKKYGFKLLATLLIVLILPVGVFAVQRVVKYFSSAASLPANLVIDLASDNEKGVDVWRNLAQGGEEKGRMLAPVINQVADLHPEYIRIDHVFDFDNLDEMVADISATGAKPFISLSYMPPNLSVSGDVADYPKNWTDWENLVTQTIEYVSGELGVSDVYYEVWNEPDLFGGFKTYGNKNYLTLYHHSVIGASRAKGVKPFKIGGPATTGFYPNWMKSLIKYTSQNNLRLDFVSWHRYSKKLDDYRKDVSRARSLGKELVISELGPNSENDVVYDSKFGAIHQIAVSVLLQNNVSRAFVFEIIDGPNSENKYWGRWGMYTHSKFGFPEAKPRASAISFLNNLNGGIKIDIFGQGSNVLAMGKKINDKTFRFLVVNYDPKGINKEAIPIKLANLASRNFSLKRSDFLGRTITKDITPENSNWETVEFFEPNTAAIFEVVYK